VVTGYFYHENNYSYETSRTNFDTQEMINGELQLYQ